MQAPTEIDTGFRIIRLVYHQAELSDFGIEFLDKYRQRHLAALDFSNKVECLDQYLVEQRTMLQEAQNRFVSLQTFQKEIFIFNNMKIAENDLEQLHLMERKVAIYNTKNDELIKHTLLMQEKCKAACDLRDELADLENNSIESFEPYHNLRNELFKNYKNYEIDIVRFDADEQEFLTMLGLVNKRWGKLYSDFNAFVENEYSDFINKLNEFIAYIDKNREIRAVTVSLPESPEFNPDLKNQKQYYIQPDDPRISQYTDLLDKAAASGKGVRISLDFKHIKKSNILPLIDIIMVSQHKDTWIENLIFKMEVDIVNISSREPAGTAENVLGNRHMLLFLEKLGKNPMVFFFLESYDLGLMCLAADILLAPGTDVKQGYDKDSDDPFVTKVFFTPEDLSTIFTRFFDGCAAFYLYCEGTTIDTRFYIEAGIKKMMNNLRLKKSNISISYEEVVAHCEKLKSLPFPFMDNSN
jgi:hypothetical protein